MIADSSDTSCIFAQNLSHEEFTCIHRIIIFWPFKLQ